MARRRRRKVENTLSRRIKLTYLQSLQVTEGTRPAEDFFDVGADYSSLGDIKGKNASQRADLANVMGTKFPYNPDPQSRRNQDTGWVLTDEYEEVDWSKVVYRVGVREVGLNSFQFAPVSSRVSVPIQSPKPIWKVTLKTQELVPNGFDPRRGWIWYHVSADDGKTWHRINPLDKPTRFNDDGTVVPRVITINSEVASTDPEELNLVSAEPVKRLRLKYTLFADPDVVDGQDGVSPVIKSVQLLMYPRGGLSGADAQDVI